MLKERKWLYHGLPAWIHPDDAVFFVTVCCQDRGKSVLCHSEVAEIIFDSVSVRLERGIWFPYVFLLMPDHVHAVVRFNTRETPMAKIMAAWKSWIRKKAGVVWQSGFFDHRLRNDNGWREKADYVLLNPVRAGLVDIPESWKYVWFPKV